MPECPIFPANLNLHGSTTLSRNARVPSDRARQRGSGWRRLWDLHTEELPIGQLVSLILSLRLEMTERQRLVMPGCVERNSSLVKCCVHTAETSHRTAQEQEQGFESKPTKNMSNGSLRLAHAAMKSTSGRQDLNYRECSAASQAVAERIASLGHLPGGYELWILRHWNKPDCV